MTNFQSAHTAQSGRKIFRKGDMIVISDPHNPEGGTAFIPDRKAMDYFKKWVEENP